MADDLCLNLQNGTKLVVPNRLDAITTYVILEQERWFEKEWGFIPLLLQPGMVAIDIGANLGIYSMAMARVVGPQGRVYAYEPTSETRARLEKSKAVNGADNLVVLGSALSNTEREGRIVFGSSSELNRLGEGGEGEAVHLTSLDIERQRHGWERIDFIKIDAEGEELKIIAGGKSVFEADSPVVMFEIQAEAGIDLGIGRAFEAMGYGLYRLLPDEQHLVPFEEGELDGFELNLFAVKPERADELAARELLVERDEEVSAAPGKFRAFVTGKAYAQVDDRLLGADVSDADYAGGLDAYAGWRDEGQPIAKRFAALRQSVEALGRAVAAKPDVARLVSLGRAQLDLGSRVLGRNSMIAALKLMEAGGRPEVAFLSPTLRHEQLDGSARGWIETGCLEAVERADKYSSYYRGAITQLEWLCGTKYATYELERRRVLSAITRGQSVALRKDLSKPAPDHLNAETWATLIG